MSQMPPYEGGPLHAPGQRTPVSPKPSIGRVVHVWTPEDPTEALAGIITGIYSAEQEVVHVTVFPVASSPLALTTVPRKTAQPTGYKGVTWDWPPRI